MFKSTDRIFQISQKVRKHLSLNDEEVIFFFTDNVTLTSNSMIGDVYLKSKDPDGWLYIQICEFPSLGAAFP